MKKLWKCRKALSPVVAAIILIAVTVAVSIAVAAWMGALTFTFMQTEELKILSHSWSGTTYIDLNVKNTGSASLTMSSVQVNSGTTGVTYDFDTGTAGNQTSQSVAAGGSYTVRIWYTGYTSGVKYEFAILTAGGNKYTYVTTAP
jgi:flagellin-like protein